MMKKEVILRGGIVILLGFIMAGGLYAYKNKLGLSSVPKETAPEEEPVRIGIVTDIGYCSPHGFDSEEHLKSFLEDTISRKVDFQISLGDNAKQGLSNCTQAGDQDVRFIVEKIRSNGVPSHFVLGDHDITSNVTSYQAWLETTEEEKTYYSFDVKEVHVVILDTILGGDPMSGRCEEVESCKQAMENLARIPKNTSAYQEAEENLERKEEAIKETRSAGRRDVGRLGEEELRWLESDIKNTSKEKVVVFSDHPLFPFQSERKGYNPVNADRVRTILKESQKQVVFISGEAHLWHDEIFEGQQFYIIDLLDRHQGSWAIFEWNREGFHLERVVR